MRPSKRLLAIPGVAFALAPASLAAGSASGTMAVSLRVEQSCHLEARAMTFGAVGGDVSQVDAQSQLSVACSPDAAYAVGMDDGRQGANGKRRMAGAKTGEFVEYDIYRDAARTQRWGADAATGVSGVIPASGSVVLPVYGRTVANYTAADRYDDTITVTISF